MLLPGFFLGGVGKYILPDARCRKRKSGVGIESDNDYSY
jgi:hypothetical protein